MVADPVKPLQITRSSWRDVAIQLGVPFAEIEALCSNQLDHRARVETRKVSIMNLKLPTWDDVMHRDYQPWETGHVRIDTAGQTPDESIQALRQALGSG